MTNSILRDETGRRDEDAEGDRWRSLVVLAQLGDIAAFEEFYICSARWLLSRIRRIVTDGDAEDVLAEVFIQAWRSISSYDGQRGSPAAWLAVIARSRALDHVRARKGHSTYVCIDDLDSAVLVAQENTEETFVRERDARQVRDCMRTLEGKERLVLGLSYFSGYTLEEIAQAMEIPVSDVRRHMAQARRNLRALLAPSAVDASAPLERRQ